MKKQNTAATTASGHKNKLLVATLTLIAFVGMVGLGTVWFRHEISYAADNHKRHQQRITEFERRIAQVDAQIASSLNPAFLITQNTQLALGLSAPTEAQIIRVEEEVEVRLAAKRNGELFATSFVPASFVTFAPTRR